MGLYETFHPVVFLWSMLWGVFIYGIYDILRCVRTINHGKMWISVLCDILFMIIFSFIAFIFALAYNFGEIRIYMIVGMLISFFVLRFTVGRLTVAVICKIYSIFSGIVRKIFLFFKKITTKLLKLFSVLVYNLIKLIKKLFSNKGKKNETKFKNP